MSKKITATNVVVIGTQWGDEGKGKIVDLLTEKVSHVVRFQGGHNAGHTLVIGGQVHRYEAHERYFQEVVAPWVGRGVASRSARARACERREARFVPAANRFRSDRAASGTPACCSTGHQPAAMFDDLRAAP